MTELTSDQRTVRDIAKSLTEAPRRDSYLTRWKQGLQERFGVGRYITHVEIRGGVGDHLTVKLGNVVLNRLLPQGVEFRGYRHVQKDGDNKREYASPAFHFYDPIRRHVGLTVECDPSAFFQLPIQKTPVAGLIILHEMGHVWDDENNPDNRILHIRNSLPVDILDSMDEQSIRAWYLRAENDARIFSSRPDPELLRGSIEHSLNGQARQIAFNLMFKEDGIGRLVPHAQFNTVTEEVAKKIAERVLARGYNFSRVEDLAYAIKIARDIAKVEEEKFFRKFVKEKEENAWEWVKEERARLRVLDSRISLWDGNENALVLLKAYFVLHHPEVKFKDIPDGELKKLLEGITDLGKIFEW